MAYIGIIFACLVILLVVKCFLRVSKLLFFAIVLIVLVCGVGGVKLVNLNMLSDNTEEIINRVISEVGSNEYVRVTDLDEVQVFVEGEWLNVKDVSIVGIFTKDIEIVYEGKVIKVGESGVVNTLRVLNKIGILD